MTGEPPESVELGRDLFVVVPHPGHVDDGVAELERELQLHGDPGLHVDGPTPVEPAVTDLAGERRDGPVLGDRGHDVAVWSYDPAPPGARLVERVFR